MGEVKLREDGAEILSGIPSLVYIFLLAIYAIGYTYLKFYYSGFGIDIEYYISLIDIVFFTINQFFATGLSWIMLEVGAWILYGFISIIWIPGILYLVDDRFKGSIELVNRYMLIKKMHMFRITKMFFLLIFYAIIIFQSITSLEENIGISTLPWLIDFLPAVFISMYLLYSKINEKKVKADFDKKTITFLVVFFISSIFSAFLQGSSKSKSIEFLESRRIVTLITDDLNYKTDGIKFFYIGETSSYIFLFDREKNESIAVLKTELPKIIFKTKPL